jgi:NAD(P)-dependent dehydrogenase (short-subunit alcohol dehydrogenase family)
MSIQNSQPTSTAA